MDAPQKVLDEVEGAYEETLGIPKLKPTPQWMLMPVGLLGAGKTTIVKPLAKHFSLLRISTDEIREQLKRRGYTFAGASDIAHALTKKYLELGYSLAIDANTGSTTGRAYNKKTLEFFPQIRQLYIHINPPDEYIISKLKAYPHTWLFKDDTHAIESFLTNKKNFVLPDLPFVYSFDTSKEDLNKQLNEAMQKIQTALDTSV